ncbi:MAG: DMT family transporter [Candidatus Krumholzibacteriia bacterium]
MTGYAAHPLYGESMAVLAAVIFAWTSVLFTTAGDRLGVTTVNLLRLPVATLCLGLTHVVVTGDLIPAQLGPRETFWIGLSGVVGLAVGDSALFRAFTLVGPRRGMMMMATAPVFTAVAAWLLLGERLGPQALAGIALVIGGVLLATARRDPGGGRYRNLAPALLRTGLLLALVAAAGQGLGSAFAKLGMTGAAAEAAGAAAAGVARPGVDPLGATLTRMFWASVAYWLFVVPRHRLPSLIAPLKDRRGALALAAAILLGPFVSVWISLVAIKHAEAGVAQVLLGTVPIFVILPAWLVYRDRPSPLALAGVGVAVGGGALLFLR